MSDRNSFELAKELDFDSENEKEKSEVQNKVSNLMQRSWSSAGFTAARTEHRLETRSKSAQKLHQFDYNEIYKRKREERARQMEEEIKAQANSFKSRPMPNFREKKETNFPLRITVPIIQKY
uniref:Uncharacterized protein n=1 Tax=Megaselia scalaris TaxID=36166 RepID=T1GPH3_MEGSC